MSDFFSAIQSYFEAHRVIVKHRLWPYLFIPGLLSVLYVVCLIILGAIWFDDFSAYVNANWVPEFMQGTAMFWITTIVLWMLWLVVGYTTYKSVILIVFSPLLSYISELVETRVFEQEAPPFSTKQMMKDIGRGLHINLRNLLWTIVLTIPAWLLIFIPGVGAVVSAVLMFAIQAYYAGAGLVDYTLERKRFSVADSVNFVKLNRGSILGVGAGFAALMLLPVVGWFTAPAYGTVAATLTTLAKVSGHPQSRTA